MNVAICDDLQSERAGIKSQVAQYFADIVTWEYENGDALIAAHVERHFDLILLDMLMPGINGIQTAEKIRAFDYKTPIIFITTTEEFAVQSYRVLAFDYILKPVNADTIKHCLNRVLLQKPQKRFICVDYFGVRTNVLLDNILFLESHLRKVNFHILGDKMLSVTAKLDHFLEITRNDDFCRCHKSYIVNLNHVTSITGEDFHMIDGSQIRISRTFLSDAKKAYFDYVFARED